jgi:hypothetical protein
MKTRITATVAVVAVLVAAFAAVAVASTAKGTLTSFKYTASTKVGKLHTISSKKVKSTFLVTADTNCGVSMGQSGDQIACKTLGKSKYAHKPVRVTWAKDDNGDKVASLVVVDLSR